MLIPILYTYNVLFTALIVVLILDWLYALDKINPVLDKWVHDESYLLPVMGVEVIALLSLIFALITDLNLFMYFSLACSLMSIGILLIGTCGYSCYIVLAKVRQYFIERKA
ncbi:membrane protein [Serratia phage BF]|uniref:Uncharacterized protein n=1 Tax=Serratia phage BF TaxID=1962671 RepID=A0A1S6UBG6_9CAUD|nr:membrane protein [Serratia phage BF]AQW89061.1 hypothetical protein BF_0536 [Serratia phage BF]